MRGLGLDVAQQVEAALGGATMDLSQVTYPELLKFNRQQLKAFIIVRKSKNPLTKLKLPSTKGNVQQAEGGLECLLKIAKDLATCNVLAEMPHFETPTVPKALEVPETLIRITKHNGIESYLLHLQGPLYPAF